jgi:antirestriction protein ArdC
MSKKVYEMITKQITQKLEEGVVPWKKPFKNGIAVNWKTQKPYRGINTLLLDGDEYATFNQIKKAGGTVKKGEKSHVVVFWKLLEVEDNDTEEEKKIPYLRYYRVFDVGSQVEGIEPKCKEETFEHDPIAEAEKIKENYMNAPAFSVKSGAAYYVLSEDRINVPPIKDFEYVQEYYSTLFHEMIHSTGHNSRLDREGIRAVAKFGSERYSKEELIAELGASMLCGVAGIDIDTLENSASYIHSWLRALKEDKTLIVIASQQAQKASDYIQNIK